MNIFAAIKDQKNGYHKIKKDSKCPKTRDTLFFCLFQNRYKYNKSIEKSKRTNPILSNSITITQKGGFFHNSTISYVYAYLSSAENEEIKNNVHISIRCKSMGTGGKKGKT